MKNVRKYIFEPPAATSHFAIVFDIAYRGRFRPLGAVTFRASYDVKLVGKGLVATIPRGRKTGGRDQSSNIGTRIDPRIGIGVSDPSRVSLKD